MDINELTEWVRSLKPQKLSEMSADSRFSAPEKKFLYDTGKQLSKGNTLSLKQMKWLHSIFSRLETAVDNSAYQSPQEYSSQPTSSLNHRHLCVRLAWHDTAWNGNICQNPNENDYCVGEQSLLSDRLRRRRNLGVECAQECRGESANCSSLGKYQPPCFWSINAYGSQSLKFFHDNPAEASFPYIEEEIPPYSVISWPFDLAFVHDKAEKQKLGSYYPKELFERRIKGFHEHVLIHKSIMFLYCKFSNPVSGDDSDYLLVGAGLVGSKGSLNWFDVSETALQAVKVKKKEPNFPTLNWALRYSMDFDNTGVRIPYQEYLALINSPGGLPGEYLDEIKVVVREQELIDGFTYVAKHVDDDQAIFLLMKLRQSLLEVKRHNLLKEYDVDSQLSKIDYLLMHTWDSRGYLPGLRGALISLLGISTVDTKDIDAFINSLDTSAKETITLLINVFSEIEPFNGHEALIGDIIDKLESYRLEPSEFLRLASLNLTSLQFERILKTKVKGLDSAPKEVAKNPYLLFESYAPQEQDKDKMSGEKIDSVIDLFKIDIALFPQRRYQLREPAFHNWKLDDKRRVRAVLLSLLRELESQGHCYDTAQNLAKLIAKYPLFYQLGDEFQFNVNLESPDPTYRTHFEKRIVISFLDGQSIYYLKEVFDNEKYIAHIIENLMAAEDNNLMIDSSLIEQSERASHELKTKLGSRFDPEGFIEERKRIYSILPYRKFSVLTGSPGSGKSYELLKLVDYLSKKERYLILSLTGKAVMRLRNNELNLPAIQAKTIDKFLYEIDQKGGKSIVNTLIIEEASMVDLTKFAEVLRAVDPLGKHFNRLILVGDENQLPPIGFGKPFADIIDSLKIDATLANKHFVSLSTNCRAELPEEFIAFTKVFANENKMSEQALDSIVKAKCAPGMRLCTWKTKAELYTKIKDEFLQTSDCSKDLNEVLDQILELSIGLGSPPRGLENFQVMTPYRAGYFGISGLNLYFQSEFRKSERYTRKVGEISFKFGDKLMHTKNEYHNDELFVSNGSLGVACEYNKVFFSEKDSATPFYQLRYLENLELAYAITVHKSQGCGFGHVFVIIPNKFGLLSRELLFTALTRTKKHLTLFVQAADEKELNLLLHKIRTNSAITGIRTTLSFGASKQFAYIPEEGIQVKSRVEYIIYRKLKEAVKSIGGFTFKYENSYKLKNEAFDLHPDFTIWLENGDTIYWEHLGRLNDKSYLKMWDSRRAIYDEMGDLDKVMTTDELNGICDEKIEGIIKGLLVGTLSTEEPSNRYSRLHLSLR